jgi:hypothetical protein
MADEGPPALNPDLAPKRPRTGFGVNFGVKLPPSLKLRRDKSARQEATADKMADKGGGGTMDGGRTTGPRKGFAATTTTRPTTPGPRSAPAATTAFGENRGRVGMGAHPDEEDRRAAAEADGSESRPYQLGVKMGWTVCIR